MKELAPIVLLIIFAAFGVLGVTFLFGMFLFAPVTLNGIENAFILPVGFILISLVGMYFSHRALAKRHRRRPNPVSPGINHAGD